MTPVQRRLLISFRYERRGQTNLWDRTGFQVVDDPPGDQWRTSQVYVGEQSERLEWIYVQIESTILSEDDTALWKEEAVDEAQDLADSEFRRRHPGAFPM